MLLKTTNLSKSMGARDLFHDLNFYINPGDKVAVIGRNGEGKTTFLKILSGEDTDFGGTRETKKDLRVTITKQEHLTDNEHTGLEYILKSVPHYYEYEKVLNDFEQGHHEDMDLYSKAQEYFTDHGYYYIKDMILSSLADFQLTEEKVSQPLSSLSGGEKRYIELVRMMYSQSELLLIDEPTNHMDYMGKDQFIAWMETVDASFIVITHDRDVLKHVNKIVELKDKKMTVFNGNYEHYLKQNATQTTNSVKQYQNQLNKLEEAKKRVEWGLQMRAKSKAWKTRYDHWVRDYEKIKEETVKPSFWIDQKSTEEMDKKVADSYHKFKEKNIKIAIHTEKDRASQLVEVRNLSLGYSEPLFSNLSFTLKDNDRVFIKGRNGAGKSTLVRTILSLYKQETPQATIFEGEIKLGPKLRIGEYEQEINKKYLSQTLEDAIMTVYEDYGFPIDGQKVKALLSQYLFDPSIDGKQKIADLSGGQKARFQIIKMLAAKPNLLILDEPTNHLDLPSIEEMDRALESYIGGILYISHDTYFIEQLGGEVVTI